MAHTPLPGDFLYRVAEAVHAGGAPRTSVVVLPSSRAIGRFRKAYAAIAGPGSWMPRLTTMQGILSDAAETLPMDPIEALGDLFEVWKELGFAAQSAFLPFARWAETALRDFNAIDHHLLDARNVLRNLCDIKEIEAWSFADPSGLTPVQTEALAQWQLLLPLYEATRARYDETRCGPAGYTARRAAERGTVDGFDRLHVAGLGALTPAEHAYLARVDAAGRLTMHWDADRSYVDRQPIEAGRELRRWMQPADVAALPERLATQPPRIVSAACSSRLYAATYVRATLDALPPEDRERTALVLPDGAALPVVLTCLGGSDTGGPRLLNVTMGLALAETPVRDFLDLALRMAFRSRSGWYHADLRDFLGHAVVRAVPPVPEFERDATRVLEAMAQGHWAWVGKGELERFSEGPVAAVCAELALLRTGGGPEWAEALRGWLSTWRARCGREDVDPRVRAGMEAAARAVEVAVRFVQRTPDLCPRAEDVRDVVATVLAPARIDLLGEPDEGLQVMGLIETRALDFDRVFVLDCNEGTLPKTAPDESFIPADLRVAHELPMRHEREAAFAYSLYRLLHSAREVHLLHVSELDAAEPSRYLEQLKRSFRPGGEALEIERVAVAPPLPGPRPEIPPLVWDDELRGRLRVWAAQGASPSALNTLFTCERNFLYSYLFRLREPRELEEQMAASTFGSIVHHVLEHGLHDARGRVVTRADLQSILDRLPALLRAAAIKEFNEAFTESGENFLSLVLAEATVRKLVQQEMLEIDEGAVRTLESLESEIHRTFEGPAALGPLKLRGKADRIEREGGLLRIVDYKTGKVEQREVDLKAGWQETLFEGKKSKAVQLLAYCAMSEESPVQAAIRSGRAARSGLLQLRVEKNALIEAGHVREFIDLLGTALTERLGEGRTAAHAHDAKYCPYCVELNPEPEWG